MKFEIYQENHGNALTKAVMGSIQGQWRWRLRGGNKEPLASGESFHNRQDCIDSVKLVMSTSRDTVVVELPYDNTPITI